MGISCILKKHGYRNPSSRIEDPLLKTGQCAAQFWTSHILYLQHDAEEEGNSWYLTRLFTFCCGINAPKNLANSFSQQKTVGWMFIRIIPQGGNTAAGPDLHFHWPVLSHRKQGSKHPRYPLGICHQQWLSFIYNGWEQPWRWSSFDGIDSLVNWHH